MKHFLITRFNIRTGTWNSDKNGNSILDEEWMRHRFNLFETYCFPSVKGQSDHDFIWIVVFDTETSEQWKERIRLLQNEFNLFYPLFVNGYDEFLPALKETINANLTTEDKFILTSRMDNDDLIHRDYIKTIKYHAQNKNNLVIDLRRGYQVNLMNGQVKKYYAKINPFLSVVEHVSTFKTVFSRILGDWAFEKNHVIYKDKECWVQVVHDRNKHNYDKTGLYFAFNPKLTEFQMDVVNRNPSNSILGFINIFIFIKNNLKMMLNQS